MARNKTGRDMLLAEIGRLEGLLNVRGSEEAEGEGKDEVACKGKKSSEDLVKEVAPNATEGGDGTSAKPPLSKTADFVEEVPVGVDSDVGLMDDVLDADLDGGSEILDAFTASETTPGIEDEITQDSLDEVAEEVGADDIATEDRTKDVVAGEYVGRLAEASRRLDRVASYLEKSGQVKLAFRIDRLADALDSERSRLSK